MSLKGNILYLAFGLLFFSLLKDAWYFAIILILYLSWLTRIHRYYPLLIIGLAGVYYLSYWVASMPLVPPQEGRIIRHHPVASRSLLQSGLKRYWVITEKTYPVGAYLSFEATPARFYRPDLLGAFDRPSYDQAQGVSGRYFIDAVVKEKQSSTYHQIPAFVGTYISENFTVMEPYLRAFILADRSAFDEALTDSVNALGISHIFAISGLHITLVALSLDRLLKPVISQRGRFFGISGFLAGYGLMVGFPPSFIRASFIFIFGQFQSVKKEPYTALDGLSIIFIVMLVLRPYALSDLGFVLSYLVTLGLLGMRSYFTGPFRFFKVSLIAFSLTFPILMGMHGSVNLSSIFFNAVYVLALTLMILPITYLAFLAPFLEPIFSGAITFFEAATLFFHTHFYWPVTVPFLFGFNLVIYYAILGFLLIKPHHVVPYLYYFGFLVSLFFIRPLQPFQQVTILDVDGDAMIFEDRFSRCVGLIDGGGPATASLYLKHLKLMGYRHFDIVIVTHDHLDHTAGIQALLDDAYFQVEHLITEKNAALEIRQRNCGQLTLVHYPWQPFPSKNDRSLVTGILMDDFSVLIPGDIERRAEIAFTDHLPYAYTYLQLPHHGSNTSASEDFLDHVNPRFAWANLPHHSRHNYPHDDVIKRLEERHIRYTTTAKKGTFIIRHQDDWP